jgi:phosphoadenosine phosphosulfate reductase
LVFVIPSNVSPVDRAVSAIQSAQAEFGSSLAVLTSFQREGVVMIDLALKTLGSVRVMTIDTGRLPAATHQMIAAVEALYGITVERIRPDHGEVDAMVAGHGADLFYDGVPLRNLCCNIRKVRPLALALKGLGAYFTGLRREQSETRQNVDIFDRTASPVKINALADWTAADVASYTLEHQLPQNRLYAEGYTSIGCEPCTRATTAGEDERAGRWWWETDDARECGLHFSPTGKVERTVDVLLRDILEKVKANA